MYRPFCTEPEKKSFYSYGENTEIHLSHCKTTAENPYALSMHEIQSFNKNFQPIIIYILNINRLQCAKVWFVFFNFKQIDSIRSKYTRNTRR